MNADVEELLREGLDRLTAGVRIPPDLLERACARRRRRLARRGVLIGGMAAVTAAARVAVTAGAAGLRRGQPLAVSGRRPAAVPPGWPAAEGRRRMPSHM
jgi:hypothetical protein